MARHINAAIAMGKAQEVASEAYIFHKEERRKEPLAAALD